MNTRLVGGVLLVGGASVIAYYFLFRKKKDTKVDLSEIKSDIKLADSPVVNIRDIINRDTFNPSKDFQLDEAGKERIREIVGNIPANIDFTPNMQPIDLTGLEKLGLGNVDWAEAVK